VLRIIQIICICFLLSCQNQNNTIVFDHLEPWTYSDKLKGSIRLVNPSGMVKAELTVNYDDAYPYENLYIKFLLKAENETLLDEVKSLQLQNELGQWKGRKYRQGYSQKFILKDSFPSFSSVLNFEIIQYSRNEILSGINSISLQLVSLE